MSEIVLEQSSGKFIHSGCGGTVIPFCLCGARKCESCKRIFPEGPCSASKSGEHNRP